MLVVLIVSIDYTDDMEVLVVLLILMSIVDIDGATDENDINRYDFDVILCNIM